MSFQTQVDTSTLSNQNIATALLVHTFTNTTRVRKLFVAVDVDQIAGNGDYVVYATVQRAGAGSAYSVVPRSTVAVPSGVTAAAFLSAPIILNATDVLKVYVTGLAADTTTPDITTRVWEELATAPIQATTIAVVSTQTSFTLTAGSADDDAYNGCYAVIEDATTAVQKAVVAISDYVGSTRTVTLVAAAAFTVAAGDRITIIPVNLTGTTVGTVNALAADSVNASALAANAVSEIQSGLATPATVWSYATRTLTQTAAEVASAIDGDEITIQSGDTVTIAVTGLGSLTARTGEKLWFTVKSQTDKSDDDATIQVGETTGAIRLNAGTTTASYASIVVTDAAAGSITITLKPALTVALPPGNYFYDIQILETATVRTLSSGDAVVAADVTKAIA